MMKLLANLKLFKALLSLTVNPERTDQVFVISKHFLERRKDSSIMEYTEGHLMKSTEAVSLFEKDYNPEIPSLQNLDSLPEGTFGKIFARHMLSNGLEIDFYPHVKGSTFLDYVAERARKSHDFWHVLTGFDTSVPGELGLQAFTFAQLRSPFSIILLASGAFSIIIKAPHLFSRTMDEITRGFKLGSRAILLIGFKFEEALGENLDQLRVSMGLSA